MAEEIRKTFVVGDTVYRKWRYPDREDYWWEGWPVEKVTASQVHIRTPGTHEVWILKRKSLERSGFAVNMAHGAVFYTEMPDEYRKQTLGYLFARRPREILRLPDEFTPEQLKDAYRIRAQETHPDRGGDPEEFRAVQAAYERLRDGPTIGDLLRTAETG
jgi:hypothetical protein